MNEKDLAVECITAAYERIIRRLWILCIIIFLVCTLSNFGWLYHESKYKQEETIRIEQEADDGGNNNYIGNDGDINN